VPQPLAGGQFDLRMLELMPADQVMTIAARPVLQPRRHVHEHRRSRVPSRHPELTSTSTSRRTSAGRSAASCNAALPRVETPGTLPDLAGSTGRLTTSEFRDAD
jgi:hypothetical protein